MALKNICECVETFFTVAAPMTIIVAPLIKYASAEKQTG